MAGHAEEIDPVGMGCTASRPGRDALRRVQAARQRGPTKIHGNEV